MSAGETTLNLDDPVVKRQIWQAYQLLLQLAEDKAADSQDLPQDPELPTAMDGAHSAPPQVKG